MRTEGLEREKGKLHFNLYSVFFRVITIFKQIATTYETSDKFRIMHIESNSGT